MIHMLCRNRVQDFARWKAVFDANREAGEAAGLTLVGLWTELGDPNHVFFRFEVEDLERAKAFISAPEAARAGEVSGVLDGECFFVREPSGT